GPGQIGLFEGKALQAAPSLADRNGSQLRVSILQSPRLVVPTRQGSRPAPLAYSRSRVSDFLQQRLQAMDELPLAAFHEAGIGRGALEYRCPQARAPEPRDTKLP